MRINKFKSCILTVSLILLILILTSIFVNAEIQDYDEIGFNQGERYEWTLSEVDEDVIEDLMGVDDPYDIFIRDGKQMIFNIEKIVERSEGFDNDNWTVEIEYWYLFMEADDEGYDEYLWIYKNPEPFISNLNSFFNNKAHPLYLPYRILFIPKDVEDFLDEAASRDSYTASEGLKIQYKRQNTQIYLKYRDNGILERAEIKYNEDTCYVLELTYAGLIPLNLILLIVIITSISACIAIPSTLLVIKKRKKSISSRKPEVQKEQLSSPVSSRKIGVYCNSCQAPDSITRERFYYFTCKECGKYSFNIGYLCKNCNKVYPLSQLDFINLQEPDKLLCYKCNNVMELLITEDHEKEED